VVFRNNASHARIGVGDPLALWFVDGWRAGAETLLRQGFVGQARPYDLAEGFYQPRMLSGLTYFVNTDVHG